MKYLAFIFAFYLMGMLLLPCNDAFNECTPAVKTKASDHSHKADTNDTCSPFCNCSCCHTIVDLKFFGIRVEDEKPVFEEKEFLLTDQGFVSSYYGNIWQPPKINA